MIDEAVSLPDITLVMRLSFTFLKGIGWNALLLESEEYMGTKIKKSMPINPDEVMQNIRKDLVTGRRSEKLRKLGPRCSIKKEHPGMIVWTYPDGSVRLVPIKKYQV